MIWILLVLISILIFMLICLYLLKKKSTGLLPELSILSIKSNPDLVIKTLDKIENSVKNSPLLAKNEVDPDIKNAEMMALQRIELNKAKSYL